VQTYVEDFNVDRPVGSFGPTGNAVPAEHAGKLRVYDEGWRDTAGSQGSDSRYSPTTVLSVENGCLVKRLYNRGQGGRSAAVVVGGNQLGGRYAVRMRAVASQGWKTAFLLWPQSEVWPRDGEIDWPEGSIGGSIAGFMHRQGGTSGGDQDYGSSTARHSDWHTYVIEWTAGRRCVMSVDGVVVLNSTSRVPSTPMRWVLQTETNIGNPRPANGAVGKLEVDWVALWRPA